jgi:hypothetical protein
MMTESFAPSNGRLRSKLQRPLTIRCENGTYQVRINQGCELARRDIGKNGKKSEKLVIKSHDFHGKS